MSPFTEKEIDYLRGQRLGRLATASGGGSPHIVPVGFRLDAEAGTIEIGGHGLSRSKKWRDLQATQGSPSSSTTLPAWTRGPLAGSRSAAAPNSTTRAVSSASAAAAGTLPGSASCRSASSAGASRGPRSQRKDAAPAPSKRHDPGPRQAGEAGGFTGLSHRAEYGRSSPGGVSRAPSWPGLGVRLSRRSGYRCSMSRRTARSRRVRPPCTGTRRRRRTCPYRSRSRRSLPALAPGRLRAPGRYVLAHMPPSAQAVRLAGDALMGLGAHRRSFALLLVGAAVIAAGWSHAVWPRTSARA